MTLTVAVQNRIVGAAFDEPVVPTVMLEFASQKLTVSKLIRATVSEQIERMLADLGYQDEQVQRALDRRYLTASEVSRQAGDGKVSLPVIPRAERPPQISKEGEIKKARDAFVSGVYMIVVDGHQAEDLNEVLTLKPNSKVTFIRMMPLRGG
jgi:hypothetical protein